MLILRNRLSAAKIRFALGALWFQLKALCTRIKHRLSGSTPTNKKLPSESSELKSKNFSDYEETYKDFEKSVQGYGALYTLSKFNLTYLLKCFKGKDDIVRFNKVFPTLIHLLDKEDIKHNLELNDGKMSIILVINDGELLVCYDFENKKWFANDCTYNPPKAYSIKDFGKFLIGLFDPELDPLLKHRIEKYNEIKEPGDFDVEDYCMVMRESIGKFYDILEGKQ